MELFRLAVKAKGRTVLPAGLQRACGFAPGAQLVARPLGKGRFVVESTDAVLDRIWSGLPLSEQDDVGDGADLDRWRTEADGGRWTRLERPDSDAGDVDDGESQRRSARLLGELDL